MLLNYYFENERTELSLSYLIVRTVSQLQSQFVSNTSPVFVFEPRPLPKTVFKFPKLLLLKSNYFNPVKLVIFLGNVSSLLYPKSK